MYVDTCSSGLIGTFGGFFGSLSVGKCPYAVPNANHFSCLSLLRHHTYRQGFEDNILKR